MTGTRRWQGPVGPGVVPGSPSGPWGGGWGVPGWCGAVPCAAPCRWRCSCAGNRLGAEGCKALCEAWKTNRTLRSIGLRGMAARRARATGRGGGGDGGVARESGRQLPGTRADSSVLSQSLRAALLESGSLRTHPPLFFLLRTAVQDGGGPPGTTNRQPLPTANRSQPPPTKI